MEFFSAEKGKWSTDLSSYAHLSAEELHSGFVNRLHSNRDYEAGLVNLMKERYEVILKNALKKSILFISVTSKN